MPGHTDLITSIAEVGTAGTLVTSSADSTVKVWSLTEQRDVRTFTNFECDVEDVVAVDDACVMVVSGRTLRIFRISDGQIQAEYSEFPNVLWSCSKLSDSRVVVGDMKGRIFKLQRKLDTFEVIEQVDNAHDGGVHRIFARSAEFATCSWDKTAKFWDAESLGCISTFRGHTNLVVDVVFDDNYLVTASVDSTVRVYNVRTGNHLSTLRTHKSRVNFVHLVQGKNWLISGGLDRLITVHRLPNGRCLANHNVGLHMNWGIVLSSGALALTSNSPNSVDVFEINQLRKASRKEAKGRTSQESAARHQFKAFSVGRGKETLTTAEATTALNMLYITLEVERKVDEDEFSCEFVKVSCGSEVDEESFVKVFLAAVAKCSAKEEDDDYWTHA